MPVIKTGIDRDSNAHERHRDEDPAQTVQIWHQWQDGGRGFGSKCRRPDREPLAPLPCGTEVDMDEPRARVETEPEEPDFPRRRFEGRRIVVRHGDVESRTVHVLGTRRATNGAVVLRAAIGGADDQRLAQPVAERLHDLPPRFQTI